MSSTPFKVKAVYDYSSPHDDDLSFATGQVITVTEEEDADWYVGEYTDDAGQQKSGLFPKNFVEKYEPQIPSRPARQTRPKESIQPATAAPVAEEPQTEEPPPLPVDSKPTEAVKQAPPLSEPEPAVEPEPEPQLEPEHETEVEPPSTSAPSQAQAPTPVPAPAPAAAVRQVASPPGTAQPSPAVKKAPPPVSEKPSSFRDRIAAFNKQESPVTPFKPSGPAGGAPTFIKKPFVAPPPSRNAYVPPPKTENVPKVYRREEDPEIAERQAQEQAAAENAGLTGDASAPAEGEAEQDVPKPQSLKERIALLQKQQMEQAQRRADTAQKEKPKKPAKKRTDDPEGAPIEEAGQPSVEPSENIGQDQRTSLDRPRVPIAPMAAPQMISSPPMSPSIREHEILSDGNEADQSAAGETTEANEDTSDVDDTEQQHTTAEEVQASRAPAAPAREPDMGEQEDTTEGETESADEMDEETRRRLELRERMAKMSGGMGMAGMFGPQPGMAMPGAMPQKQRSVKSAKAPRALEEAPASPPQVPQARVPMIPVPGMQNLTSPQSEETEFAVEKENEPAVGVTEEREPDQVPDVEDVMPEPAPRASTSSDRPVSRVPTMERGAAPPVPGGRPVPPPPAPESRAVPPPPPARGPQSPKLEQEISSPPRRSMESSRAQETALPLRGVPPPVPRPQGTESALSPPSGSAKRSSYFNDPSLQVTSETDKRASRGAPPIPGVAAMGSPPILSQARPPPPPPPAAAPGPIEEPDEGESEYEGDYDTDIASGEKHKDALKAHAREPSLDDSTTADDISVRSPPPPVPTSPPTTHRAVPPPPPTAQAPRNARASMDAPRAAPPPVPPVRDVLQSEGEESEESMRAAPPRMPTAPVPPAVGTAEVQDSSDDLYRSPSPARKTAERTHERSVPAPPPQAAPPRPSESGARPSRKSMDVTQGLGRKSTDLSRAGQDGYIATDVDLAEESQWWARQNQPPPAFQNRSDVLCEIEDSSTSKRGGKTTIARDVYALFLDYSQTVITARFDKSNPADVSFEQRHEPPAPRLRQDQLEDSWQKFGAKIAEAAQGLTGKKETVVGDGTPASLPLELIKAQPGALLPVGTRAYGATVYANMANASVQQFDEIRPGDIITLRNAKLQGKHGGLHQKYSLDVANHAAVVVEWDGTKKKVRALEQGREKKKVQVESFRLGDLKSGEVRVWRVVGRDWVGWDSN